MEQIEIEQLSSHLWGGRLVREGELFPRKHSVKFVEQYTEDALPFLFEQLAQRAEECTGNKPLEDVINGCADFVEIFGIICQRLAVPEDYLRESGALYVEGAMTFESLAFLSREAKSARSKIKMIHALVGIKKLFGVLCRMREPSITNDVLSERCHALQEKLGGFEKLIFCVPVS